jgi:hypothetical protein
VRSLHSELSAQPENLTFREEKELHELQSDLAVRMRFTDPFLDKFWISVKEEYPAIRRKVINILLQFSTSTCVNKHFLVQHASRAKIEIVSFP